MNRQAKFISTILFLTALTLLPVSAQADTDELQPGSNAQVQPQPQSQAQQQRRARPMPRGFDRVDERSRAPMGFFQNQTANTIKDLQKGKDGDHAVIEGTVIEDLGDECYLLQDKDQDTLEICRSEETLPFDLAIEPGKKYMLWGTIDKSFFSFSLDLLLIAEH